MLTKAVKFVFFLHLCFLFLLVTKMTKVFQNNKIVRNLLRLCSFSVCLKSLNLNYYSANELSDVELTPSARAVCNFG